MPYQSLQGADGACGVMSTVTDLAKWDAMWANEGQVNGKPFLSNDSYSFITDVHLAMGGEGAGLGWFIEQNHGAEVISHSGGMPGFILNHAVVPEKDLAVIALGNGETYSVFAITNEILDLYLGDGTADPVAEMLPRLAKRAEREAARRKARTDAHVLKTKPSLPLSSFAGTYSDKIYGDAIISEKDGKLALSFKPAPELFTGELAHWHYDTFQWNHADPFLEPGYITFHFDGNHSVSGFKVELHSPDFHFYKLDFRKVNP